MTPRMNRSIDARLDAVRREADRHLKPEPHGDERSEAERRFWESCRAGNEARLRRALDNAWAVAAGRPLVWAEGWKDEERPSPRGRRERSSALIEIVRGQETSDLLDDVLIRARAHPRLREHLDDAAGTGLHGRDALEALVRLAEERLRERVR